MMVTLETNEARLLLNIAMMATGHNKFQSAEAILSALEKFRPMEASLASARTLLLLSLRNFKGAVEYIDKVGLVKFPDDPMLLAFKGMAYLRMGLAQEAQEPLRLAASQTANSAAAQLAKDLLT